MRCDDCGRSEREIDSHDTDADTIEYRCPCGAHWVEQWNDYRRQMERVPYLYEGANEQDSDDL